MGLRESKKLHTRQEIAERAMQLFAQRGFDAVHVAEVAERVVVMYRGANVEEGSAEVIFHAPRHPYTKALLAAVPKLGAMQGTDLPARFPLPAGNGAATLTGQADLYVVVRANTRGKVATGKYTLSARKMP